MHIETLLSTQLELFLQRRHISEKRLGDVGLGNVGITFNPHLVLDDTGQPTGWLVKRLRSHCFEDPAAQFQRYQDEHTIIDRFFGTGEERHSGTSRIPPSAFVVVTWNLDHHRDYLIGKEFLLFQRFIVGISLKEAAQKYQKSFPDWLIKEVLEFSACYKRLQKERRCIPDLFSIRSDHVKVNEEQERLYLIDTNNLICLDQEVAKNSLFNQCVDPSVQELSPASLHHAFACVQQRWSYNPRNHYSPVKEFPLHEAMALQELVTYFPLDQKDNMYLQAVKRAFTLSGD